MPTHMRRARLRPGRTLGCMRNIPRSRARDEDLHVFRAMSKISRRITGQEIDELIGPA